MQLLLGIPPENDWRGSSAPDPPPQPTGLVVRAPLAPTRLDFKALKFGAGFVGNAQTACSGFDEQVSANLNGGIGRRLPRHVPDHLYDLGHAGDGHSGGRQQSGNTHSRPLLTWR